jgi:CheY-like chemotaxis protein
MTRANPLVLIVEDNIDNRLLLHDILDLLHYDAIEAVDGAQGVELAAARKPALILMDLSLPQKSGWDAAREIKANPLTASIPIIALTAHAMPFHRQEALEAGCSDYLSKPINFYDLADILRSYLDDV